MGDPVFKTGGELDDFLSTKPQSTDPVFKTSDDLDNFLSNQSGQLAGDTSLYQQAPAQPDQEGLETNPFASFGKSIWNTLSFQLPSAGAAAAATKPIFEAFTQAGIQASGGELPDILDKPTFEKAKKQSRKDLLNWAMQRQQAGGEFSKDLINSLDKVNGPLDALNWASAALGQGVAQIPASIATAGLTSMGQEVGGIYMDAVDKIAKEKGLTPEQVIDQGLDESATSLTYGVIAGLLDRVGAGKAVSAFGKEAFKSSLRKKAKDILVDGVFTEGITEGAQQVIESIGASRAAGKSWSEALKEIKPNEVIESMAQGAVAGGGISTVGATLQRNGEAEQAPAPVQQEATATPTAEPALPEDVFDIEREAEIASKAQEQKPLDKQKVEQLNREVFDEITKPEVKPETEELPKAEKVTPVTEQVTEVTPAPEKTAELPVSPVKPIAEEVKTFEPEPGAPLSRQNVVEQINSLNLPEKQADAQIKLLDARSEAWAKQTGRKPEEWFAERIAGVRRGKRGDVGKALFQEQIKKQTKTPEFKKFFGKSKVIDEAGEPLVVYHQTGADNVPLIEKTGFDINKPIARASDEMVPDGIFMKPTTKDIGLGSGEPAQIPLFVKLENPLIEQNRHILSLFFRTNDDYRKISNEIKAIDKEFDEKFEKVWQEPEPDDLTPEADLKDKKLDVILNEWGKKTKELAGKARAIATNFLREKGYDGVIINEDQGSLGRVTKTIIALEPTQVKSAFKNRGTFDPSNPNILMQSAKGAVEFIEDNRAIIHAFENADISTLAHESAHVFRRELSPDDLGTAEKWAGIENGVWTTEAEEKFARGFERYLATGKAPNKNLRDVFEQFKQWLLNIYKSIKGSDIDVRLGKDIREVFDNLLGGKDIKIDAPIIPLDDVVEQGIRLTGSDYIKKNGRRFLTEESRSLREALGKAVVSSGTGKTLDEHATDMGITEDELRQQLLTYETPTARGQRLVEPAEEAARPQPKIELEEPPPELLESSINEEGELVVGGKVLFQKGDTKPTGFFQGDKIEYTGKAEEISGKRFYEFKFLEGHKKGEIGQTANPPDFFSKPRPTQVKGGKPQERLALGEGLQAKIPPGKIKTKPFKTEGTLFEGKKPKGEQTTLFQMSDQVESPAFKKWFGDSKVVDENGRPRLMYRGDYRGDKIGDSFKVIELNDGGSGGIYFTSDPELASSYSTNKPYSDDFYDNVLDNTEVTVNGKRVKLNKANIYLNREQKLRIRDAVLTVGEVEDGVGMNADDPMIGRSTWDDRFPNNRSDYVLNADDILIKSGTLDVDEYLKFWREVGVFQQIFFDDPGMSKSAVTPVFLSIQNPMNPDTIPESELKNIEKIVGKNDLTLDSLRWSREHGHPSTMTAITPEFRKAAQSIGYDGVVDKGGMLTDGTKHDVHIAFEPTQIKSAIGNRGTFDPSNPNILFQEATNAVRESGQEGQQELSPLNIGEENVTAYQKFKKGMEKGANAFIEWVQDDWRTVRNLQKRKDIKLGDAFNPYMREVLFHGRVASRIENARKFVEQVDQDIVETSKRLKMDNTELSADVNSYLYLRHAPERNDALGDGAAGITTSRANKFMEELKAKEHFSEVKRLADDLMKLHKRTLRVLAESEVISKDMVVSLNQKYENHVPLQRIFSEEEQPNFTQILSGKGLDVKGTGILRAVGSKRKVADIITSIVANYEQAVIRAEKNRVDLSTLKFARENNYMGGLFEEIRPQVAGVTFEGAQKVKKGEELTGKDIVFKEIKDPNVLFLRENGEAIYLRISDPKLAQALKSVNREVIPKWLRFVGSFSRFYSALATRFNPEFVFSNKIRDLQEAIVYVASEGKGAANVLGREARGQNSKAILDWMRGKQTEGAKLYEQMRLDGGTTGGLGLSTRAKVELDIAKIRKINRSNPRKAIEVILSGVDKWNTIFEDSTRLSVYRSALNRGLTRDQAARMAKEASVNFNKRGKGGPVLNAFYMFSNASIQGSAKMLKAMKNPKVAAGVTAVVGAAVTAVAFWNDEQDDEWRKKIAPWDRLNGLNVILPSSDGKFHYITIPVSWGLKPIKVAADAFIDAAMGAKVDIANATAQILGSVVEGYNPLGGTDVISTITPTILDMPVDLARNKAWTGNAIRPDWDRYAPDSVRYFRSMKATKMGRTYIAVADKIATDTGGRIEVSPEDMEFVVRQLVGGAGRFAEKTINTTIAAMGKDEVETRNIPFASRFYRSKKDEEVRDKKVDTLKRMLTEQSRERIKTRVAAESIYEDIKKMTREQANRTLKALMREDVTIGQKVLDIQKEDRAGLTYPERLMKQLSPEDRAQYIEMILSELPENERKPYLSELARKRLLTTNVQQFMGVKRPKAKTTDVSNIREKLKRNRDLVSER